MTTQNVPETAKTHEFVWDRPAVDRAVGEAVREALLRHKLLGQSIVVWKDGKCVWIAAQDIQVPEAPEPKHPAEQRKQAS